MTEAPLPPGLLKPTMTDEQQEWLDRVEKIAILLAEHRDESERNRETPPVVYDALRDAGFTRMWVSREFGGEQVSLLTGVTVIEALARIDASVAWLVSVQAAVGHLSDYLSEERARQLYKEHSGLVVGGVRPTGTAEVVDGGYVLNGEWAFASGFAHADWLFCTAVVTENGEPVKLETGQNKTALLFVPQAQAQPRDTWHTLGMRATGSHHFRVDEAFVPEDLAIPQIALLSPPPDRPSRAFSTGYTRFVPYSDAPVTLGIAQDALDSIRPLLASKTPFAGTVTLGNSQVALDKFARAEMLVHTARLLMWDVARQGMEHQAAGDPLTALLRLTTVTVAEKATAAVNILHDLAGTSSIYTENRLERCFRDVHTANKHITMSDTHYEMVGQYLLGGPLLWRR